MEAQALKKNPVGTEDTDNLKGGLVRRAPDSKQLLKEIDEATEQMSKEQKKRRILEACGCL